MIDFIINDLIENPNFNTDCFNDFLIMSQDFKNELLCISDSDEVKIDLPF